MATHAEIVSRRPEGELAEALAVNRHQVRDWRIRDSIPPERWSALAENQIATLEELAEAAAAKRAA